MHSPIMKAEVSHKRSPISSFEVEFNFLDFPVE